MSAAVQPKLERDADLQAEVTELRSRMKALSVDLANLQTDLIAKNREIGRLKTELSKARGEHQTQGDANAVFDHWCGKMDKRKGTKFGEQRQRKVKARLREGFSTDDLRKAIDGCARFPFQLYADHIATQKPGAVRRDELVYICQDEAQVERFMAMAEREDAPSNVVAIREERRPRIQPRSGLELADQLERTHGLKVRDRGGNKWEAQCPAHDDSSPSLVFSELADGKIVLHCYAGCEPERVLGSIGWEWGHVMGGDPARTTGAVDARYQERLR